MISPRGATIRTRPPASAPMPKRTSRASSPLRNGSSVGSLGALACRGQVSASDSSLLVPVRRGHDRFGHQPMECVRPPRSREWSRLRLHERQCRQAHSPRAAGHPVNHLAAYMGSPNGRPVAEGTQASITTADRAIWTGMRAVRPYGATFGQDDAVHGVSGHRRSNKVSHAYDREATRRPCYCARRGRIAGWPCRHRPLR